MEITFLGTAATIPTKKRNHSAVLIKLEDYDVLFDCGEGTQRQLKHMKITPHRLRMIFISHWHADHTLGLPGLLQTLNTTDFSGTLHLFGPEGTEQHMKALMFGFHFIPKFTFKIHEFSKNGKKKVDNLTISVTHLQHGIPCVGYKIKEKDKRKMNLSYLKKIGLKKGPEWGKLQQGKLITHKGKKVKPEDATTLSHGKSLAYISDSLFCKQCITLAKGADALICESTFADQDQKMAKEYRHMSCTDAATIAKEANVKKLFLTHFSQRYKLTSQLLQQAKKIFKKTTAAEDFMQVKLR